MVKAISALALVLACIGAARAADEKSILTYHNAPDRSGSYIVPRLTVARASGVHLDAGFQARLSGQLYAQPLYWRDQASGLLIAATESNQVQAVAADTGRQVWSRTLGPPVSRSDLRCGNIDPLGVTGTPVIDPATQAIYVAAAVGGAGEVHHKVFALRLTDGTPLPGWPVDIADALRQRGLAFNARDQNERGALAILEGRLYVPFGGHFGDCGDYNGWVVGISLNDPRAVIAWSTPARGGGIWAPGGIASDGKSLYVATGNTFGASRWMGGEAVIRFSAELKTSAQRRDFFAPEGWRSLDARDLDLGGANPMLLEVSGSGGDRSLVLALGKDGHGYLLDRANLGGVGGSLVDEIVSSRAIRTAPAAYRAAGGAFVAFHGAGSRCPAGRPAGDLTVLKISGGDRPALATAWCAAVRGAGSPIVTTTDGKANAIVWAVGSEGDNRLHGFRGDNGEVVFSGGGSGDAMGLVRRFQTLIATGERLYVAGDDQIYAFMF